MTSVEHKVGAPVTQQVGEPFWQEINNPSKLLQDGEPPLTQRQPEEEEELELPEEELEEEELEEDELEEDELVVVEQTKLELHMELSRPLLAQHRGVPPRKEQVVL